MATDLPRNHTEALIARASALANQTLGPVVAPPVGHNRWRRPVTIAVAIVVAGTAVLVISRLSHRATGTVAIADTVTNQLQSSTVVSVASLSPGGVTITLPTTVAGRSAPTTVPVVVDGASTEPFTFELDPDGRAHMRGAVPSEADADAIRTAAAKVIGSAAIVDEYTIVPGAAVVPTAKSRLISETLYFSPGQAGLDSKHDAQLDIVALVLVANHRVVASIEGFTDSRGETRQNAELSQARVTRVVEYLTRKGVAPGQLVEAVGNGESAPLGDNSTDEGRALNRRVELRLSVPD